MCRQASKSTGWRNKIISNFGGGWFELGIAEYCSGSGNKNASVNHFERARNDRDWRKMAEYEIDRVRNPEKYEQ